MDHKPFSNSNDWVRHILDEVPLALSAPFMWEDRVIIGFYTAQRDLGCYALSNGEWLNLCKEIYAPTASTLHVHGLKRIWEYAQVVLPDVETLDLFDTKLMAYLLDPDMNEDELTVSHLVQRYGLSEYPHRAIDIRDKSPVEALHDTLAYDAELVFELSHKLQSLMSAELMKLYRELELPLMVVLYEMHRLGIGVDGQTCSSEYSDIQDRLLALSLEITEGQQVNLASPRQLFRFLLEQGIKFSNGSIYAQQEVRSTALREISHQYPMVEKILNWQDLSQDLSFLRQAQGKSRIHAVWGQTRAGTSRIYARQPALQNVSRSLRHLFVPAPGHELIKADYKQAQMRIMAHLSGDEVLIELFRKGKDTHAATAEWLGIDRNSAKEVNFGICFGMSAASLCGILNTLRREQGSTDFIDEATAKSFISGFFARYPGVPEFFDSGWRELVKSPKQDRVVKSLIGRIRRFDGRLNESVKRRYRITQPQQIEADLVKTAMVRLDRIFKKQKMKARIVMMIHDAIWVEAPKEEVETAKLLMEEMMTTAEKLAVPLEVDFK